MNPSEEIPSQTNEEKPTDLNQSPPIEKIEKIQSPNLKKFSNDSDKNNESMQILAHSFLENNPLHKRLSFSILEEEKYLEDQHEISLKFENFIMKDGFSKHQVYCIKGQDVQGSFEIFRNYKDFQEIRKILLKRWPGCYVPPLPKSKIIGNMEKDTVEERTKYLDEFCKKLAGLKYLYYSKEFQIFLRGAKNNTDLEKLLKGLGEQTYEELIEKYAKIFHDLNGIEINTDLKDKIKNFKENCKLLLVELERIKKITRKIAISEKEYNQNLSELICEILPAYEKKCLAEYLKEQELMKNSYIFGAENEEELEKFKKIAKENSSNNTIELFHELIRKEIKEIEAFLEAIDVRDKWEKKKSEISNKNKEYQTELQDLTSGRNTMSSILSFSKKEDNMNQLKNSISESIKNIENLQLAVDIINAIIGHIEIKKFKAEKIHKYYRLIAILTTSSTNFHKQFLECWVHIHKFMNLI